MNDCLLRVKVAEDKPAMDKSLEVICSSSLRVFLSSVLVGAEVCFSSTSLPSVTP